MTYDMDPRDKRDTSPTRELIIHVLIIMAVTGGLLVPVLMALAEAIK